ncbi:hypothetical protein H0243_02995 [Staphylococcus sciuri]|uniref:hypothetical protein n=1 Tax=Mammaliicoccus sciuri TaxID=1296 RepID=UPI000878483F|nr:hypothetical protein [Mammaliicoccus sciuri]MBG9204730.1 hypothetical protein [Mammaliicoccus sciuri]
MAYEYENENTVVAELTSLGMQYDSNAHYEMADEVEEVYAKAKAWDNHLADVENSVREVTGNEDEVKWHVDYVINEYMEDK